MVSATTAHANIYIYIISLYVYVDVCKRKYIVDVYYIYVADIYNHTYLFVTFYCTWMDGWTDGKKLLLK